MAAGTSGAKEKSNTSTDEEFLEDEEAEGSVDFDEAPDERVMAPVAVKDPSIRRKIEDRLERSRLRDELGIFDTDWDDI